MLTIESPRRLLLTVRCSRGSRICWAKVVVVLRRLGGIRQVVTRLLRMMMLLLLAHLKIVDPPVRVVMWHFWLCGPMLIIYIFHVLRSSARGVNLTVHSTGRFVHTAGDGGKSTVVHRDIITSRAVSLQTDRLIRSLVRVNLQVLAGVAGCIIAFVAHVHFYALLVHVSSALRVNLAVRFSQILDAHCKRRRSNLSHIHHVLRQRDSRGKLVFWQFALGGISMVRAFAFLPRGLVASRMVTTFATTMLCTESPTAVVLSAVWVLTKATTAVASAKPTTLCALVATFFLAPLATAMRTAKAATLAAFGAPRTLAAQATTVRFAQPIRLRRLRATRLGAALTAAMANAKALALTAALAPVNHAAATTSVRLAETLGTHSLCTARHSAETIRFQ